MEKLTIIYTNDTKEELSCNGTFEVVHDDVYTTIVMMDDNVANEYAMINNIYIFKLVCSKQV